MYEESGGRAAPVLADRYRVVSQLGRGGTARVLRAWDERLDREVAVKIFQPHADPVGRLRFEDEAKLLAGFDHPGLVKVYDSGCADGEPYLVLELINGPQLGRRIDLGPMPPDDVSRIGIGLAEALAYVHSRGVVHRDVKPGNVLLSSDGQPHLADFGLAKLLARSGMTASDRIVGTAAYLSPEQVLGTDVGPPSDIYGLGLVLLECLTGEIEYPGFDAETVVARLNRSPKIPESIPPALAEAIEAMTRSDPAARPTAEACAELLRSDRPTVPIKRPRKLVRAKAAALVGAALAAGVVSLVLTSPTSGTPSRPQQLENGTVAGSTPGSAAPGSQIPDDAETPQPTADQRHVNSGGKIAKTPPPSVSTSVATSDAVTPGDDDVVDDGEPDSPTKTKKPKKTKTKTKTGQPDPSP
ncbi:serine/threonine protein kinase [Kibdelosporangium banguiense]|uniref:non-specific serine/threonine protein kinase n=1 Tax=Kibdelosporangium banguiense TaxID=1365924 RepID=A0ABS4TG17_9PSEU|nr:serine/threonine-protein kinase [Kibdelosporangium banguiense]MBP2323000.1 serine/threonine protein kinase [Kibdelosporangium banguiense]